MLKVYCYSRCTTCKKALKWLEENGIEHEVIDIKADHPEYEWNRCIRESRHLTKGHKWRLFVLDLSFIGWFIVGILCLGVGTLWVEAYQTAAKTQYYNSVVKASEPETAEAE